MGRLEGCGLAFLGAAIAAGSVFSGFSCCVGAAQDVNLAGEWASLGLGLVGTTIGVVVFVKGVAKAISGADWEE